MAIVDVNNYEQKVISASNDNRKIYGSCKIKKSLILQDIILSQRKIHQIMIKY
ncbi:hypothetical protein [Spiroplasma endosymbiont of Polydrusus formosus]|uniref:hypothetical protein n=1 Tax=Spiroplasma endosymbiont of Polydrusus formosus TaxID=3139326 RepID=UPI0035B53067